MSKRLMAIKIEFNKEVFRIQSFPQNFENLNELIFKTLDNKINKGIKLKIYYHDSDGDEITISNTEDLLSAESAYISENKSCLKFKVREIEEVVKNDSKDSVKNKKKK